MSDTIKPKYAHTQLLELVKKLSKEQGCYGALTDEPALPETDKVNLTREELLWLLVMMGDKIGVKLSLKLGADSEFKHRNVSLWQLAKAYEHDEIVALLEHHGAKPETELKKQRPVL